MSIGSKVQGSRFKVLGSAQPLTAVLASLIEAEISPNPPLKRGGRKISLEPAKV
jgi:hypothetical protein